MLEKIISGGQTGVDRAALDAAIANGLNHGGWCPGGRKAEDGRIDDRYALKETDSSDYRCRTQWNVRDADATLVLHPGILHGGTALTVVFARSCNKPLYILDIDKQFNPTPLINWLKDNNIKVLNIAGPRESNHPGIYRKAYEILQDLFNRADIEINERPQPHS